MIFNDHFEFEGLKSHSLLISFEFIILKEREFDIYLKIKGVFALKDQFLRQTNNLSNFAFTFLSSILVLNVLFSHYL